MSPDEELEAEPRSEEEALAQAELLNDRRVLLTCFLKLAMFGAVEMKLVAPIFGRYITVRLMSLAPYTHINFLCS